MQTSLRRTFPLHSLRQKPYLSSYQSITRYMVTEHLLHLPGSALLHRRQPSKHPMHLLLSERKVPSSQTIVLFKKLIKANPSARMSAAMKKTIKVFAVLFIFLKENLFLAMLLLDPLQKISFKSIQLAVTVVASSDSLEKTACSLERVYQKVASPLRRQPIIGETTGYRLPREHLSIYYSYSPLRGRLKNSLSCCFIHSPKGFCMILSS